MGDWVTLVGPIIGDISTGAGLWWSKVKVKAEAFYTHWLNATPIHRAQIEVSLGDELSQPAYSRLEQRVTSMLLAALPENLRQDILASRLLSSVNVLYRVMIAGQPGGTAERSTLLTFLTQPGSATTPIEALDKLRKYSRWRARAEQLQVSFPDPSLLLRAVEAIISNITSTNAYRDLAFRLSVLKLELSLDHVPTHEKVEKFRKQVQAEMELLAVSSQVAAQEEKRPRVRKTKDAGDEGGDKPEPKAKAKGGGKGNKGKDKDKALETPESKGSKCKFWGTAAGCVAGRGCQFGHDRSVVEDGKGRCFECSSTEHWRNACPVLGRGEAAQSSTRTQAENPHPKADPKKGNRRRVRKVGSSQADGGSLEAEATAPAGESTSAAAAGDVLKEAVEAIKSLRVARLRVAALHPKTCEAVAPQRGLLDGGATTSVRKAKDQWEWSESRPTVVHLASGSTKSLRLNRAGILLASPDSDFAPIVALHQVISLGYTVRWSKSGFQLVDASGSRLPVMLVSGCPEVSAEVAHTLISQIESGELQKARRVQGPMNVPFRHLAMFLMFEDGSG